MQSTSTLRRPLRSHAQAGDEELRQLEPDEGALALISFDVPRAEAALLARSTVERLALFGSSDEPLWLTVFRRDGGTPQQENATALDFHNSVRWKRLCKQLVEEAYVTAAVAGSGFEFGTSLVPQADVDDPQLPTLALRFGVADTTTLVRLEQTLDGLMLRGRGVQAVLGRWIDGGGIQRTTYERICGIQGPHTLRRSWLTRYLRGVDHGPLWLGPDLVERVGDLTPLFATATVTVLGEGLKITPNPARLDELEHALAAILPGAEDCRA